MIRFIDIAHWPSERTAVSRAASSRSGILMVEVLISALLIGTAMAVLLPGMVSIKRQRLDQRFEILAMIELKNVAELVKAGNASPKLSAWFQNRFRSAAVSTEILTGPGAVPEGAGLTAVRISVGRPKHSGHPDQVVSVVIWIPAEVPQS